MMPDQRPDLDDYFDRAGRSERFPPGSGILILTVLMALGHVASIALICLL